MARQWVHSEAHPGLVAAAHLDLVGNRRQVDVMNVSVAEIVTATGIAPGGRVRGTRIGNVDQIGTGVTLALLDSSTSGFQLRLLCVHINAVQAIQAQGR